MSHTPEPWRVELRNVPLGDTGDYEGVVEILSGNAKRPIIQFWDESEESEANARRIVACVNACEGMDTESLESIAGRIAAKSVLQMHANYVSNKAKVAAMEQQRDKLLAALERIGKYPASREDELGYMKCRAIANAVIAEVRGGK